MINVVITGRATKDFEMKKTKNGKDVIFGSVASNRKDSSGNKIADFIDVTAYGKTAEVMSKYIHKGDKTTIFGELNSYKRQDGSTGYVCVVRDVELPEKRREEPRNDSEPLANPTDEPPFEI